MSEKIANVEDQNKFLVQNSIKYLNSLTKIKELSTPTLKSLYRTKCRLMELRRHIYLPQEKPNFRCQRCFMNFSEGLTKYEVRPVKLSDFAKRVLQKIRNSRVLTTYQRMYYKKLKKRFPHGFEKQNKLVILCYFCKKESEILMTKPKKTAASRKKIVEPVKKKKKSKKDKLCGLNVNVVSELASKKKNRLNQENSVNQASDLTISSSESIKTNIGKNNLNASVSMTNTRSFQTADFIPLEAGMRRGTKIKLSKNNVNNNMPQLKIISKSKEKLQQKNLKNLTNILKKASENKNRHSSNLKKFLSNLC